MTQPIDLHIHSSFSDGKDDPEDIVLAAIDMGLTTIGFSDHAFALQDLEYCIPEDRIEAYKETIRQLSMKYRDRITIYCGIEQDLDSPFGTEGFDYAIGSVHHLCRDGSYAAVDDTPEILKDARDRLFGGDIYALTENYYQRVAMLPQRHRFQIVGHFDLVSKFNEKERLFDPSHPRYAAAWQAAADSLLQTHRLFEINTGAISRGWRSEPYPSREMISYIAKRGGSFLLSSDSHSKETLAFQFDKWEHLNALP